MKLYKEIIDSLIEINSKNGSDEITFNEYDVKLGCLSFKVQNEFRAKSFINSLNKLLRIEAFTGISNKDIVIMSNDSSSLFFVCVEVLRNFNVVNSKDEQVSELLSDSLEKYHTVCGDRFKTIQKDISVAVREFHNK